MRADELDQAVEGADTWVLYVVGVLLALDVRSGMDIEISSDVPVGAGLSSSAALECSVAVAVDEALGLDRSREQLVEACVRAETETVGAPVTVKGTRAEGLGALGRAEGIACFAVALVTGGDAS